MQSKNGLKRKTGPDVLDVSVTLLISGILLMLAAGCAIFSKSAERETIPTEPVIRIIDNSEYWCLEKRAFTAILQSAERCE